MRPAPAATPRPSPAGTGRSAAPEPDSVRPSFERSLDRLEQGIRRLQIEYERFFAGALPFPPEDLRQTVVAQLRELRSVNFRSPVDQFRFGGLEARFNSYSELFGRRQREREEGRAAHSRAAAAAEPQPDPRAGVVLDAGLRSELVEALYQELYAAGSAAKIDLDSFRSYLGRQLEALKSKTGCAEVQFRIASEEGKTKLLAKPVGARASSGAGT